MTKVYVYTAIFGKYDQLPNFRAYDEEVEYYCFSDEAMQESQTWKNVVVPRFFRDNKLNSGFLKTNVHLLFSWDSVVVWVDANLIDINLDKKRILELVSNEAVAVTEHYLRSSVLGEAAVIAEYNLDDKIRVSRWENELRSLGYPDNFGLAETRLLIRDLRVPKVRAVNRTWWDFLLRGSRRDQLSFNVALWLHGVSRYKIESQVEVNGENIKRDDGLFEVNGHKSAKNRVIDSQVPMSNLDVIAPYFWQEVELPPSLPEIYPALSIYHYEFWDDKTLCFLREINKIVQSSQESLKDSYCHFNDSRVNEMSLPDVRRSWKREYLRRAILPARFGLQIGFNAGYGAAIMLCHNPVLKLVCIDTGVHSYCNPCAEVISKRFDHRFSIHYGQSKGLLDELSSTLLFKNLDFVHIDGGCGLSDFASDLSWFMEVVPVNCRLIVDNAYAIYAEEALKFLINKNLLQPYNPGFPSCGENRLFIKRGSMQKAELEKLVGQQEFKDKDLAIRELEKEIADIHNGNDVFWKMMISFRHCWQVWIRTIQLLVKYLRRVLKVFWWTVTLQLCKKLKERYNSR